MNNTVDLSAEILIALVVGAFVASLASCLWLTWFSPPTIVVFVSVFFMVIFRFAMPRRPIQKVVQDPELEQILTVDEASQ